MLENMIFIMIIEREYLKRLKVFEFVLFLCLYQLIFNKMQGF